MSRVDDDTFSGRDPSPLMAANRRTRLDVCHRFCSPHDQAGAPRPRAVGVLSRQASRTRVTMRQNPELIESIKTAFERNGRAVELRPAMGRKTAVTKVRVVEGVHCEA